MAGGTLLGLGSCGWGEFGLRGVGKGPGSAMLWGDFAAFSYPGIRNAVAQLRGWPGGSCMARRELGGATTDPHL